VAVAEEIGLIGDIGALGDAAVCWDCARGAIRAADCRAWREHLGSRLHAAGGAAAHERYGGQARLSPSLFELELTKAS
jgi:hypothetical protein